MAKEAVKEQEWKDITNEEYRKYVVVTARGIATISVDNPKGLKEEKVVVGEGENSHEEVQHVILDEMGEQHVIPYGWLKLSFKLK